MAVQPLIIETIELHDPIVFAYESPENLIQIPDLRDWPSGAQRIYFQAANDINEFVSLLQKGKKEKAVTMADTDKIFRLQRIFETQVEDENQRFYFAGLPAPVQTAILAEFAAETKRRRATEEK